MFIVKSCSYNFWRKNFLSSRFFHRSSIKPFRKRKMRRAKKSGMFVNVATRVSEWIPNVINFKDTELPVQWRPPECVFVSLGHFGTLETELLVFHAIFRGDRACRAVADFLFGDTHKALPGCAEKEFFGILCTIGVGRTFWADTFPFFDFQTYPLLFRCHLLPHFGHLFEFIHSTPQCSLWNPVHIIFDEKFSVLTFFSPFFHQTLQEKKNFEGQKRAGGSLTRQPK